VVGDRASALMWGRDDPCASFFVGHVRRVHLNTSRQPTPPELRELVPAGDDNGAAVWRRITAAVTELPNTLVRPAPLTRPLLYVIIRRVP